MSNNPQTPDRRERYVVAIHDAMEPDLSLVDQEPGCQALFARAAEAAVALADSEQAELRREHAERLEHLEGALARIRDRAEVAQVRVRRVVAGSPLAADVEAALAGQSPAVPPAVPVPPTTHATDEERRSRYADAVRGTGDTAYGNRPFYEAITDAVIALADAELAARRAADLRDAEEICDEAGASYTDRALNEHADAAYTLMERFRRKAEEAEQTAAAAPVLAAAHATEGQLASLAVNAANALSDEKRHYRIACEENARLRATIDRVRRLHDALDAETDLTSPDDEITRGRAAWKIAAALDGWTDPAELRRARAGRQL